MKLLTQEKLTNLLWSAGISGGGLALVVLLSRLFPTSFDWVQVQTALLTAISAWIVNTVKEALK